MMIPSAYWNQKKSKKETKEQSNLDKDTFIYGQGKVPQFQCTLCGDKAWYIGMVEIFCSNKDCKWYCDPHKKQEEQEE